MEIIIGLVVVAVIAYFVFFRKAATVEVVDVVAYKVETPVEVQPEFPAPVKKPRAKKPAVKAKTARKPKAE
jgi:hypothetical protein